MIEKTIDMIEKNAGKMAEELKQRLLSDADIKSYRALDDRTLYEDIFQLYSRIGYWLLREQERGELRAFYSNLGAERFEEGFPLHEAIQGLIVTKRHIWDTVLEKKLLSSAAELNSGVDFITFLNRYFDFAIYYTTVGYYNLLGV